MILASSLFLQAVHVFFLFSSAFLGRDLWKKRGKKALLKANGGPNKDTVPNGGKKNLTPYHPPLLRFRIVSQLDKSLIIAILIT